MTHINIIRMVMSLAELWRWIDGFLLKFYSAKYLLDYGVVISNC